MSNEKENKGISQASTQKKISFFSAILVVIGSSIGAGIFFKSQSVLDNSEGSLLLAIFCWIIAAISVVAMALALVEVVSARNDNLSVIGWTKVFNSRRLFKASKNFMFYIYLPLTYFFMPLYVIMSLQDGIGALVGKDAFTFGTNVDWLIWTIISLAMSSYFIYASGMSSRVGNIQNKIVTYIKFIPLAAVALIGFILAGINGGGNVSIGIPTPSPENTPTIAKGYSLSSFTPGLGIFLAISAIFFAYDGFYVAAGIQSEMAEPKKTPMAILFGLLITTVIYLIIAISMSINGGSFFGMLDSMKENWGDTGRILFGVINIMIAIGVLGIINGFAMWAPRFTEDLIKEGELPFSFKYKNRLNDSKPMVGIMYSFTITIPIVIIFTLIGALGYIGSGSYSIYGKGMDKLYSFADLMATWTAVFTFGFIMAAIYGCLKNRNTKNIETEKKSYFKPMAIIAVIVVGLALVVTILIPIIDLTLLFSVDKSIEGYIDIVVGRVMLVVALLLFAALSFGVSFIEDWINIKKHGSIEQYEAWQSINFDIR